MTTYRPVEGFLKVVDEKKARIAEESNVPPTYCVEMDFERFMNGGRGEMRNVTPKKLLISDRKY